MDHEARAFLTRGWLHFPFDETLARWVRGTVPAARAAAADPANAHWLRCGGTWFAGVNVLPNDASGGVHGGPPLHGRVIDFIGRHIGLPPQGFDRAQISICYPGYPKPGEPESEAAFAFRLKRDAAHIDGIGAEGPLRRRYLREPHAFVLGIPLSETSGHAAPLVIWEGSHHVARQALLATLAGRAPEDWTSLDITEPYQAVRRTIFETCPRLVIAAKPGEAYLIHRLALHGVAPWADAATAGPDGRMIAYFRPNLAGFANWLAAP